MWRTALGTTLGWTAASLRRVEDRVADARRTAAFLRARVLFVPRADDIYIATYPRSGTTWMQFMLHLLARGPSAEFRHINDVCPWFERSLAIGSVTLDELERLPSPRIFKTHLPREWLPSPGRYVAITRDPADVALSYFRLYRAYLGFTGSLDEFLERFERGDVQYGSYWAHVEGWRARADAPDVTMLRYEDLRAEPLLRLTDVARHCGLSVEPARLEAAVSGASLPRMKELEARFDHATSLLLERGVTPARFIGRGRVGGATVELSDAQRDRLEAAGRRRPGRARWLPAFLH